METCLFESKITYTKAIMKESLKIWFFTSKLWVILLLPGFVILPGILTAVMENEYVILGAGIFLETMMLLVFLTRYHLSAKINYDRCCEQNEGQEMSITVQFLENDIIILNDRTGNKTRYSYTQTKSVRQNKKLIVVLTRAKVMIIADKANFTVGNAQAAFGFVNIKVGQAAQRNPQPE